MIVALRKMWTNWWSRPARRNLAAWTLLGLCAMILSSVLVAGFGALARRSENIRLSASGRADHPSYGNRLDPLIAGVADDQMPPHWDWRLLKAMVEKESSYNPKALSAGGAVGLGQLLPKTAHSLGLSRRQFYDPEENLTAAARYLRIQYDRYHAVSDDAPVWLRTRLAIASYNAGAARVRAVVKVRGERGWSRISRDLPVSTVRHVNTIVDKLYPRFVDLHSNSFRPRIGNWKSSLRFFGDVQ